MFWLVADDAIDAIPLNPFMRDRNDLAKVGCIIYFCDMAGTIRLSTDKATSMSGKRRGLLFAIAEMALIDHKISRRGPIRSTYIRIEWQTRSGKAQGSATHENFAPMIDK